MFLLTELIEKLDVFPLGYVQLERNGPFYSCGLRIILSERKAQLDLVLIQTSLLTCGN